MNIVVGQLAADREWFVQTPVEIRLRDGVVVAASTELPGIRDQQPVVPAQAGIQVSSIVD